MLATVICYTILAAFFVLERALRRGSEARAMDATPFDRGTTRAIGLAFLACVLVALIAPLVALGQFGNPWIAWVGVAVMTSGIWLRAWANRTLGAFYTRTLKTTQRQAVISNGPYRVLRHPGYAGVLLMWLGAGLALRNWIALVLMVGFLGWAYRRRINAEEEMLLTNIGKEYREYSRTWRIIPFIY